MKKLLLFLTLFLILLQTAQAQTPQWYWPSIGTSVGDNMAMTSDNAGNTYVFTKYLAGGQILGVKFNSQGAFQWATQHQGASFVDVSGALLNSEGRLFIGMDSQTNTVGQQQMAVIEINPTTGAIIQATEYTHAGTSRDTNQLALQANGTDLMLVANDVILKIDASDLSIQLQWQDGVDPAFPLAATDIKTALNETDVTNTLTKSGFENTLANMPFFTGSPLANTKEPTDVTNYSFPAETSFTFGVTNGKNGSGLEPIPAMSSSTTPWTGSSANSIRSAVETSEGLFVYFTMTLSGNDQQGVAKMSKTDIYTVEWAKYWRQSKEPGALLADENSNVYLYSWDHLFFLQSAALDILANKFDKDGNVLWSKTFGTSGGNGNEVIWRSGAAAIDQARQEIVLNLYTDSFNGGAPSSLLLSTNYDGVIQNYSILAPTGGTITPVAISLDGQGNAYIAGKSGAGPMSVAKVNTTTLFNAPTLVSATKDSNTQITVVFSDNVKTNGTNPTDFTVTDGSGTNFAVSTQADGTAGDTNIVLTVANLSTALGDLKVTYTNNNNEISDTDTGTDEDFVQTDATGVIIDLDTTAPTLSSVTKDSNTQITLTLSEAVQTNGTNPTDFTVKDEIGTSYAVSAQADGTAKDNKIVLTVADLSAALGDITISYANNNNEVSDFGGNVLASNTTGVIIDSGLAPIAYNKIYWAEFSGGLKSSDLDGSNVETITGISAQYIKVDNNNKKIYYFKNDTNKGIYKADLDGTNPELVVLDDNIGGFELDFVNGKVYWAEFNTNKLRRSNLDGTNIEDVVTSIINPVSVALDVNNNKIYWTEYNGGKVRRANIDGTSKEDLVTGLGQPVEVELDLANNKMYFTDRSKVWASNLDGSSLVELSSGTGPQGLAFDNIANKVYFGGGSGIYKIDSNGTNQTTLGNSTVLGNAWSMGIAIVDKAPFISGVNLATDNSYIDVTFSSAVYNTNSGSGAIEASDFDLSITGGSATNLVISSVKKNDNASEGSATALVGGETTVRIFFSITGTPTGAETLEVDLTANSIFSASGDVAIANQTANNTIKLNDVKTPTFENSTPSASSITQTGFTLSTDISESGTIYYIALEDGDLAVPSSANVKAGFDSNMNTPVGVGSQVVNSGGFTHNFNVGGLASNSGFDVYVVAEDTSGNLQATPTKIDVSTLTQPTVTLSVDNSSINEASGTATLTATLSAVSSQDVTVTVAYSGTAINGTDYNSSASTTITINAGATSANAAVIITPVNDTDPETNETIIVDITGVTNGTENGVQQQTITILDDDTPTIAFASTSSNGLESVSSANLTVNTSLASGLTVTVDYAVTGTATGSGTDYTLANGTLTFNPGSTTEDITIASIVDDAILEANETVIVTLSNPSNANLGTNQVHTYTINNNDAAAVTIEDVSGNEDDGPITITAILDNGVQGGFTIDINSTDDSASSVANEDYIALINHTLTFTGIAGEKQTFTIIPTKDSKVEADEQLYLGLRNVQGTALFVAANDGASILITNDDSAAVTIADVSGNEDDGAITLTATLDNAVDGGFTVDVGTTDGTATTADSDYTAVTAQTLTFAGNAGETQTFTITPTVDTKFEADETVFVGITNLQGTPHTVAINDGTTVTIKDDDLIPAVITFTDIVKTYGDGDFNLGATSNSTGTISYSIVAGGTGTASLSGTNNATVTLGNAGTVTIRATLPADGAYDSATKDITVTISKATLTATADDTSREYGDANPAFTVSYTGFKGMDTKTDLDVVPTASSSATATTDAGTSDINVTGGSDTNYTIAAVKGTLTINKATLIVTAKNTTFEYGDNFTIDFEYGAFKNGEDASVLDVGAYVYIVGSHPYKVGTYPIVPDAVSDNNYTPSYVNGTLTVTKATLTATADDKTKEYGEANPTFTVSYTGFKGSDSATDINTAPTASSVATATTDVGTAVITVTGGSDNNYTIASVSGTLTIGKATLTATAEDKSKEYGEANPAFTISYAGFKGADSATDLDTAPTASSTATSTTDVGTVVITTSAGTDSNYTINPVNGTLTVGKATLVATADDKSRIFGASNPVFTITYDGFKGADDIGDIDTVPVATSSATDTTPVGTASIDLSAGIDNNYTVVTVNGTLTILLDTDGDGIANIDDTDDDNDGILDVDDNSPLIPNSDQKDTDGDGVADVEEDCDNDGIVNYYDTDVATCQEPILKKKSYGFSPNGDGVNDGWVVEDIELFPNNVVQIFNRSGKLVFKMKGYDNTFEGTFKGKKLPVGPYLYIIDLGNGSKPTRGWMYINY